MQSSQTVGQKDHAATLYPMQSNHNSSAILASRPKATISQFSDKALLNYSAYQSVNSGIGGGNPIIVNQTQYSTEAINKPKGLMPGYPKK